jgi:hypothetical protein
LSIRAFLLGPSVLESNANGRVGSHFKIVQVLPG